jgi:hypothetical protein
LTIFRAWQPTWPILYFRKIAMALFRKKSAPAPQAPIEPEPAKVEWDLAVVAGEVRERAGRLEGREIEPELMGARIADHCRDCQIEPPRLEALDVLALLDADALRRLALAVGVFDRVELRAVLLALTPTLSADDIVQCLSRLVVLEADALTVDLIRQSEVRAEEFARHLSFLLGVAVKGESAEESKRRRHALDYKRLLAEAEEAKRTAEEKLEALRKRQQEDPRRARRGKW